MIELSKTEREFAYGEFNDYNGVQCSLQKSSLATDDAIWIGANDVGLKQFIPHGNPSWQDLTENELKKVFPRAEHFSDNCRMHLSREQVKELLPALQHFVETGDLPSQ